MRKALVVALPVALLLGLALSQVGRDTTPPGVFIDVEPRVAAGAPLDVLISASEPVTFDVVYGSLEIERVDTELRLNLLAEVGPVPLVVTATDGAGNSARQERTVYGVPAPEAELRVAPARAAGDPVGVQLDWRSDAPLQHVVLRFGDTDLAPVEVAAPAADVEDPLRPLRGRLWAFAAVPLDAPSGLRDLKVELVDGVGNRVTAVAPVQISSARGAVQTLALHADTLALVTPAARTLEAQTLADARAGQSTEPQWADPFVLPIEGRGTSGFGVARRYAPGGPVSYHQGEDIAAPAGTPVRATNRGIVRIAGTYPIKGGWIAIDHGAGVFSHYFHQEELFVEVGDVVERGQVIGRVGTTGLSTGPHLHWEMRVGSAPTNPMAWVGARVP